MTFEEMRKNPNCIKREFFIKYGGLEHRSSNTIHFDCPYCGDEIKAYVWSLNGEGKKCECGAFFTAHRIAYKVVKN